MLGFSFSLLCREGSFQKSRTSKEGRKARAGRKAGRKGGIKEGSKEGRKGMKEGRKRGREEGRKARARTEWKAWK